MGNDSSLLKNVDRDNKFDTQCSNYRSHCEGTLTDGSSVSVFVYVNDGYTSFAENCAAKLKSLRHPGVIKFNGLTQSTDGLCLVTEPVVPLNSVLSILNPHEICSGICNILEALVFLHTRARISHNNITLDAIFVSEDKSWKLGNFDCSCSFDAFDTCLPDCQSIRTADSYLPEDDADEEEIFTEYGPAHGHARDAYLFGLLCLNLIDYIADLGDISKSFETRVRQELLSAVPAQRPSLSSFLSDPLFRNEFIEVNGFLRRITVKSEAEKHEFFSNLLPKLLCLPEELIACRLVPPLMSRFVLLDETAKKSVVPHLLTPRRHEEKLNMPLEAINEICPLLPLNLYKKYVLPEIYKIFHVHDVCIRLVLLSHFADYVDLFDDATLADFILPQVLLGVSDINDELVSMSLHCLADLVPLLGGDIVTGSSRTRIFSQGNPRFASPNKTASLESSNKKHWDINKETRNHSSRELSNELLSADSRDNLESQYHYQTNKMSYDNTTHMPKLSVPDTDRLNVKPDVRLKTSKDSANIRPSLTKGSLKLSKKSDTLVSKTNSSTDDDSKEHNQQSYNDNVNELLNDELPTKIEGSLVISKDKSAGSKDTSWDVDEGGWDEDQWEESDNWGDSAWSDDNVHSRNIPLTESHTNDVTSEKYSSYQSDLFQSNSVNVSKVTSKSALLSSKSKEPITLGSEFEIKAIDCKKGPSIIDPELALFAELVPTFTPQKSLKELFMRDNGTTIDQAKGIGDSATVDQLKPQQIVSNEQQIVSHERVEPLANAASNEEKPQKSPALFDMQLTSEQSANGWSEDLEWSEIDIETN